MLPTAAIFDSLATPHAGGAVEVEEHPATGPRAMLQDEMSVEQNRFYFRQERIIAVEMRPAGLHHANFRIAEMVDHAQQPIFRSHEIGVEDSDEFTLRTLHAVLQRAGFESLAVRAMDVSNWVSQSRIALYHGGRYLHGFVGRIIQQLDVELVLGIFQLADRLDEALDHVLTVEDRQLYGHARQFVKLLRRLRCTILLLLVVHVGHRVAMQTVSPQNHPDDEVGEQQHEGEGVW